MKNNVLKKLMVIGVGSMLLMGSSVSANELHAHRDDNRDHICDDENCKEKLSDHSGGTATCIKKAVCNICGKEYGEVDSNNHINTTLIHSIPPTCNKDGFSGFVHCLDCGTTMYDSEETIIPARHSGGTATCASQAVCEVCGKSYGNFNGTNHAGGTELRNVKGATCTEDGYTGDRVCADCGTKISTGTVIPATGHSGGTATCKYKAVCKVCGEEYGDLDSNLHDPGAGVSPIRVKPRTCTEDGYTGDFYCNACGSILVTGEVTPATGHKDTDNDHYCNNKLEGKVTNNGAVICNEKISECSGGTATCVSQAVCDICKKPYGEEDSDNHAGEMVTRNNKEATCEEDGYSGDTYCESCNNVVETGSELPRLGHIDEDTNHICDRETCGKVLSECTGGEATCKDQAICEYCGSAYGELDAANHVGDTEIRDAKPATCCEDGYTGDTYCTSCDAKLLDGTVIPALGHIDIPETETETETEKQTETETEPITEPVTEKETEKQTETEKQPETTKQTEAPKPVTPATEKIVETESAYPVAPQTGDDTPFAAVAGLLVGSGAILAGGVAIKRRRK